MLKSAGLPALEWYDVLLEIERAGPLRPRDLQSRLLLAQSNLSRLLDRMERAGLIARGDCEQDGRGLVVRSPCRYRAQKKDLAGLRSGNPGRRRRPARPRRMPILADLLKPLASPARSGTD